MPTAPTGVGFWMGKAAWAQNRVFITHQHQQTWTPWKGWEKELLSWIMRMQREMVKGARGAGGQQEQGTILDKAAALGA